MNLIMIIIILKLVVLKAISSIFTIIIRLIKD